MNLVEPQGTAGAEIQSKKKTTSQANSEDWISSVEGNRHRCFMLKPFIWTLTES